MDQEPRALEAATHRDGEGLTVKLAVMGMNSRVAIAANGFEVIHVPCVELEIGVADAVLEGADFVVYLGGGREAVLF